MQKLLLVFFLLFSQIVFAQRGFLYIKKKGFKKVKTFEEGDPIKFETRDNQVVYGGLAMVKKDSIYVNRYWFPVSEIKTISLTKKSSSPFDTEMFLWTTAGVALSTAGMTLAKWASFEKALGYSAGVGYGNYLIRYFPNLKRKKHNIGRKFSLQAFDLHF